MRHHGLTIVELLTVITILTILAIIVLPVISRAREAAKQNACLNNLHQLSIAVFLYLEDYDEIFPSIASIHPYCELRNPSNGPNLFSPPYLRLSTAEMPYVKNSQVFFCPYINLDEPVRPGLVEPANISFRDSKTTYAWHWQTCGTENNAEAPPRVIISGQSLSIVQNSGLAALLWDLPHWGVGNSYGVRIAHNDGLNAAYADNHLKWIPLKGIPKRRDVEPSFWIMPQCWQGFYEFAN